MPKISEVEEKDETQTRNWTMSLAAASLGVDRLQQMLSPCEKSAARKESWSIRRQSRLINLIFILLHRRSFGSVH